MRYFNKLFTIPFKSSSHDSMLFVFVIVLIVWQSLSNVTHCAEVLELTEINLKLINQTIFRSLINKSECMVYDDLDMGFKLQLAPTVLKVTAVEKFKVFRTEVNKQKKKITKLKSYSVLFQIKQVVKYEHLLNTERSESSDSLAKSDRIAYLSSQNEYTDVVNLNSFLLVENFQIADDSSSSPSSCYSNIDIELNKNYMLLLNEQDKSIQVEKRRHFTHPIRVDTYASPNTNKRAKKNPDSLWYHHSDPSVLKTKTKVAIFIRVPIFTLFTVPALVDNSIVFQNLIDKLLCHTCVKRSLTSFNSSIESVELNQPLRLVCAASSQLTSHIYWKRNHILVSNSTRVRVYSQNQTSILEINSVSLDDQDDYECFSYDFNAQKFVKKTIHLKVTRQMPTTQTSKRTESTRSYLKEVERDTLDLSIESASSSKTHLSTTSTSRRRPLRRFVKCDKQDTFCMNGAACYVTNPKLYVDTKLYNQNKIKYCICKEFYEGKQCEIELMRTIEYDPNEIPSDLRDLWQSMSK